MKNPNSKTIAVMEELDPGQGERFEDLDGLFADLEDKKFLQLRAEGWRPISPKRARKLRRRGESVIWIPEFGSDAWQPPHLRNEDPYHE